MKGDKVKPFYILRHVDLTGTSGTGIVALGAVLPSGRCIIEWTASNHPSIGIFQNLDEILLIHGHDHNSEIIFGNPPEDKPKKRKKNEK